jgi:hypothetical protein
MPKSSAAARQSSQMAPHMKRSTSCRRRGSKSSTNSDFHEVITPSNSATLRGGFDGGEPVKATCAHSPSSPGDVLTNQNNVVGNRTLAVA